MGEERLFLIKMLPKPSDRGRKAEKICQGCMFKEQAGKGRLSDIEYGDLKCHDKNFVYDSKLRRSPLYGYESGTGVQ